MNRQPYMTTLRNMRGFNRSVAYLIALALVGLMVERTIYYTLVDNDIIEAETPAEQLYRLAPHKAKQLGIPNPNAYKQRKQSDEEKLSKTVLKVQDTLREFDKKLTAKQDTDFIEGELKALREQLTALDKKAMVGFDKVKQHITKHKLPEVIHQRHTDAVAKYKKGYTTLLTNLTLIDTAPNAKSKQKALQQTRAHLDGLQLKRSQQPFDPNNLPHKSMQPNPDNKPKLTEKQFAEAGLYNNPLVQYASHGAYNFGNLAGASDPAYLAQTVEVKITPYVQARADALQHDPVQIYNWVRNNIEWIPSWGAMQDADITLGSKRGNAFDISSLLIALYRASGIPARYVHGTIEVPEDKFRNWAGGFESVEAAGNFVSSGGVPMALVVTGGVVTHAQMEHIWVEVAIDYQPSRGAVNQDADSWVEIDPSYKNYTTKSIINVQQLAGIDEQAIATDYLSSGVIDPFGDWVQGLDGSIINTGQEQGMSALALFNANNPSAKLSDIIGDRSIVRIQSSALPSSVSNNIVVIGARFSELPPPLQNKITIRLGENELRQPAGEITLPWAKVNNHKLTLSYEPASQADLDTLKSLLPTELVNIYDLPTSYPGYLITVEAVLRLNGNIISKGEKLPLGSEMNFSYTIDRTTSLNRTYSSPIAAGSYLVLTTIGGSVSITNMQTLQAKINQTKNNIEAGEPLFLSNINNEVLFGDNLYAGGLAYFSKYQIVKTLLQRQSSIAHEMLSSAGTYGYVPKVNYLFGLPSTISLGGIEMDLDAFAVFTTSLDGDNTSKIDYIFKVGLLSSALEHSIPEEMYTDSLTPGEAVSAVKALQIANGSGQRVYNINSSNYSNILPDLNLSASVLAEIQSAVNSNKTVITHSDNVTVNGWSGAGYIIFDNETGDGAYRIDGGLNGAFFTAFVIVAYTITITITAIISLFGSGGIGALLTFEGYLLGLSLVFEMINIYSWLKGMNEAETTEDFLKANFGASVGGILSFFKPLLGGGREALTLLWGDIMAFLLIMTVR